MTATSDLERGEVAAHSYFMPMVDLLAGVVFLLVVMLASSVLVARPEFGKTEAAQQEIAQIQKELQQARLEDRLYLEPRRRARAATVLLLDRLVAGLDERGIRTTADPARGTLRLSAPPSDADSQAVSDQQRLARALANVLARELPCLGPGGDQRDPHCLDYRGVQVETVEIAIPGTPATSPDPAKRKSAALGFLAAMVKDQPSLLANQETGTSDTLTYGVVPPQQGVAAQLRIQMALPHN